MPTIKLLSWNIQKFGPDKALQNNFIEYVCRVINACGADLVGLMEVVGGSGMDVMQRCLAVLNNIEQAAVGRGGPPPLTWAGWASDKTLSNEQYVFLWKSDQVKVEDCRLQGTTRWEAVEQLERGMAAPMHDGDGDNSLWASLKANGYIDDYGNVPWARVNALIANPNSLDLSSEHSKQPRYQLDAQQLQELVNILIADIPQEFSTQRRRPPFIMRANVRGTPTVITLFHAPGPGLQPIFSSNQIGLLAEVRDAAVGVVMGDFNLKPGQLAATTKLGFFNRAKAQRQYAKTAAFGFIDSRTFQRLTGPAFAPAAIDNELTRVGSYFMLLDNVNTSVAGNVNFGAGVIDDAMVQMALSSPYDKFLVKSPGATKAAPGANSAVSVPLIDSIIPLSVLDAATRQSVLKRTSAAPFRQDLADLATLIYNKWLELHGSKPRKVNLCLRGPVTLGDAHYMYAKSISDHLPILLNFQYA